MFAKAFFTLQIVSLERILFKKRKQNSQFRNPLYTQINASEDSREDLLRPQHITSLKSDRQCSTILHLKTCKNEMIIFTHMEIFTTEISNDVLNTG